MFIKKLLAGIIISSVLLALPLVASADALNLASAVGKPDLQVIPGTSTYGKIYFYNVDGDKTTYITMEVLDFPAGWEVEFLPALNIVQVSLGGPPIDVEQNVYVEPSSVYSTDDVAIPAGFELIAIPDKLGAGIPGYVLAKALNVKISVPASVAVGTIGEVSVKASAAYLGQTGAAIIGLERPFDFTVTTVYELTEERIITPFDWNRWWPMMAAGGIGVAVVAIVYVPKLIARRKRLNVVEPPPIDEEE